MQTVYDIKEARSMTQIMCERVNLSLRAGRYIMFMCQLRQSLPGDVVDMVEVGQLIKYASEHQDDLKPQFRNRGGFPRAQQGTSDKPANFTFLK